MMAGASEREPVMSEGRRIVTAPDLRSRPPNGQAASNRVLNGLMLITAAFCIYSMRRADPDLFGYLAYGRLFVEHGGVVRTDPFAYTTSGMDWIAFEYASQVLLWLSYHFAGAMGLIGLKCAVGAGCGYFIYVAIRDTARTPVVTFPIFALCFSTTARYFLFRPQMFTFAFFALFVAVLFRWLRTRRAPIAILPVVMVCWANLHGGFIAGLGAIGLVLALRVCQNVERFGVGRRVLEDTRALWVVLTASVVATFLNPRGPLLWRYLLNELWHDTNRRYIDEWRPTTPSHEPWSFVALTLFVTLLLVSGMLGRRIRDVAGLRAWHWLASCAPLGVAAYVSVRHVPLATIWFAPVLGLLVSGIAAGETSTARIRSAWACAAGLASVPALIMCALVLGNPSPRIETAGTVLGATHPCGSVAFLRDHKLEGNLFTPLWWGSYATWELFPRVLVSMDGRNISLFDDSLVVENLRFYSNDSRGTDVNAPSRHRTDFLLIPADRPVLQNIMTDRRWEKVYGDAGSVLFLRAGNTHYAGHSAFQAGKLSARSPACPAFLR